MLIREKRAQAEALLGAGFDQRYFHDVILGLRCVTLDVLAEELDAWMNAGGPKPYPVSLAIGAGSGARPAVSGSQ